MTYGSPWGLGVPRMCFFWGLEVHRLESLGLGGARLGFGAWGCPAWSPWGLGMPRLGFWGLGVPAWGPWGSGVPRLGVFGAWGDPPGVLGAWDSFGFWGLGVPRVGFLGLRGAPPGFFFGAWGCPAWGPRGLGVPGVPRCVPSAPIFRFRPRSQNPGGRGCRI